MADVAMSFLANPALPDVDIPRWLAIAPLLLAGGGTVARCYRQKDKLDECVKLDHDAVIEMGDGAAEEYAFDYIVNKRLAGKKDARVTRICGILDKLIEANEELQEGLGSLKGKWRVNLIDEATSQSIAFPNGYVFIHEGLLDIATSDDELAFCLAHDLAMVQQRHVEQKLNGKIWKWKWAKFVIQPVTNILHTEPAEDFVHKKMLKWDPKEMIKEQEAMYLDHHKVEDADRKAFLYMVKACYDDRAPSSVLMKLFLQERMDQFWKEVPSTEDYRHLIADPRLRALSQTLPSWRENPEWTSKDRWDMFNDMQPEMSQKRFHNMDCPKIPITDPRKEAEKWGKEMDDFMFNFPGIRQENWTPFVAIPVNLNPNVKNESVSTTLDVPVEAHQTESRKPTFTGFGGWFEGEEEEGKDKMGKGKTDFSRPTVKRTSESASQASSTKRKKRGYFLYYKKKVTAL